MPRHKTVLLFLAIFLIAFWFRTYRMIDHFGLSFDQNIAAWIVRDIVINRDLRLIGQLTSTAGIFIGPIYYYLQIPFFLMEEMDIKAILYFPIILGILTTFSYYIVFKRIFDHTTGLVAAFLHSCLLAFVLIDRWPVPTVTTTIWSVWYLWGLWQILKGKFNSLILVGVLISLIWHIQLALLPLTVLPIIAIFLSPHKPKIKHVTLGLMSLIVSSLPLILFEIRHNFSQTLALLDGVTGKSGHGEVGFLKLKAVLLMINQNISHIFFADLHVPKFLAVVLLFSMWLLVTRRKLLSGKLNIILITWIALMIFSFSVNNKTISEYYFHNLNVIYLLIASLFLSWVASKSRSLGITILIAILLFNAKWLINHPYNPTGYNEKTKITEYIKKDSVSKGYPCIAISFITNPGEDLNYRYLFWYYQIKTTSISSSVPIYTIVMPWRYAEDSVFVKHGEIGLIPPPEKKYDLSQCKQDMNTSADLLNFVD